jgi:hypothetical protein
LTRSEVVEDNLVQDTIEQACAKLTNRPANGHTKTMSVSSDKKYNKLTKGVISSKHNMFRMFPSFNTNLGHYKHNMHLRALGAKRSQLK